MFPPQKLNGYYATAMNNTFLYITTTLIWGSTWLAIQYQLGKVPPLWSISYRFALAAAILFVVCWLKKSPMRFSLAQHKTIALQGFLLFSLNYILFYLGSAYLISGLVALIFALIMIMNILNSKLFFKTPFSIPIIVGAIIGLSGLWLVFSVELKFLSHTGLERHSMLIGLGLCILATYVASLGNILSKHNQNQHLPILQSNAYGMAYGTLFTALFALTLGQHPSFDWSAHYILSLLFLSIVGSVLAFSAYLKLLGNIGPERAAYIFVVLPILSMLLSTFFENFQWQLSVFIGIALVMVGNILVVRK